MACTGLITKQARTYHQKDQHFSDPEHNFEQFWNHIKDRYAFLIAKGFSNVEDYRDIKVRFSIG